MMIMRVVDTSIISKMGPWLSFCLYLAARAFAQAVTSTSNNPDAQNHSDSLRLLMGMLRSMKAKSPYTASLLLQLDRDIALSGTSNPIGHIVVPVDDITEALEHEKTSQACMMPLS